MAELRSEHRRFLGKYDGYKHAWFRWGIEFVVILVAVSFIFQIFIGVSRIHGNSMEPAMQDGDVVFFSRIGKKFEKGDIVFARMPSGEYYVKRVVATQGDVVDLVEGILYINGEAEAGDYMQGLTKKQDGIVKYPYTVGPNSYFLVGDNREASLDSRSFGALTENQIKGKLLLY